MDGESQCISYRDLALACLWKFDMRDADKAAALFAELTDIDIRRAHQMTDDQYVVWARNKLKATLAYIREADIRYPGNLQDLLAVLDEACDIIKKDRESA